MYLINQLEISNLQELNIKRSNIDDDAFKSILFGCLNLKELVISFCEKISMEALYEVIESTKPTALNSLKSIDFWGCD